MKQLVQYAAAIILWIIGIVLWAKGITSYLFLFLVCLHFVELVFIGYRTGRKYGQTWWHCILSGMLFGFLWWLPLKKRMKFDDLTDEDFVEDGLEPWREKF